MTDVHTDGNPDQSLAEVHSDAMTAANNSWTETDKLYVSVCSALIALAALFGRSAFGLSPPRSVALVGILALLLSVNWMLLIKRYRRKICTALEGLALKHDVASVRDYYEKERQRFRHDWNGYVIAIIVCALSSIMIAYGLFANPGSVPT
jgi:hypothetical protein